ncbi:hypothetical protein [Rhizobium laguerreae]|uniref:hypothetical protein n=2 Tax=Rhizobium laguerreae TaxID=1076926 RepID=UPI001C918979|nr:hypothetical protein [Rhizobium laguerreae]
MTGSFECLADLATERNALVMSLTVIDANDPALKAASGSEMSITRHTWEDEPMLARVGPPSLCVTVLAIVASTAHVSSAERVARLVEIRGLDSSRHDTVTFSNDRKWTDALDTLTLNQFRSSNTFMVYTSAEVNTIVQTAVQQSDDDKQAKLDQLERMLADLAKEHDALARRVDEMAAEGR